MRKVQEILRLLPDLEDSQMGTTLLRSCLALPKLSFALGACLPRYIREAIAMLDLSMFDSLSDLVGRSLSNCSSLKASSPISLGGLGVHRASSHAPAAFVGSLDQSRELVFDILGYAPPTSRHLALTLEDLVSSTGRDD